jgi:hypothetical protein
MDYLYTGFWVLLIAMISISSYARNIYANMPITLGGGQYGFGRVRLTDSSSVDGVIVHSNGDYLYLVDEQNNLIQVKTVEYKRLSCKRIGS